MSHPVCDKGSLYTTSQRVDYHSNRQEIARSIASFSQVASAMSPKEKPALVFRDFEAIQRLAAPADSELDLELLVALQK